MRRALLAAAMVSFATVAQAETYRLIHAIGNAEKEIARGLKMAECEAMKRDRKRIATNLGVHIEKLGIGSITCLPESIFSN